MDRNRISAGSFDLNKWLFGGYERGIITTLYGPAGSGKTNFCVLAAVSQAKKGNKVIYIDTEGGFSIERVKQLLGREKDNFEDVLKNIILLKPVNFEEQKKAFNELLKHLKQSTNIHLIIVDGMTMLYRLEIADARKEEDGEDKVRKVNQELAQQLRTLAEIARKREIPIIATNQVYSEFLSREDFESGKERGVYMVGGNLLEYWSKCLIELKNERGKRKAIMRKHRSMPEKELNFIIVDTGIRKRGWI